MSLPFEALSVVLCEVLPEALSEAPPEVAGGRWLTAGGWPPAIDCHTDEREE